MPIPIAIPVRWGDGDRLARVSYVGRDGFGAVLDSADLHDGRLGLLQHQLFVNRANLGLLFVSLLPARAILFSRGQRNIVLEVPHASGVFGVDLQRVFVTLEIDALAFGVDFMLAVGLVPFGDGRVLVHVLDDLAPADAGVVRAEGNFALLRGLGNNAHLHAAEVLIY